jgi:hypothetical protein
MVVSIWNVTLGPAGGAPSAPPASDPGVADDEPDEQAATPAKQSAASNGNTRRIMKGPFRCTPA